MPRITLLLLILFCAATAQAQHAYDSLVEKLTTHTWIKVRSCKGDSCVKITDTVYTIFQKGTYNDNVPGIHRGFVTGLSPYTVILERSRDGAPVYTLTHNAPTFFFADTIVNGEKGALSFMINRDTVYKVSIYKSVDNFVPRLVVQRLSRKDKTTGKWEPVNEKDSYIAVQPPKEIFGLQDRFHY